MATFISKHDDGLFYLHDGDKAPLACKIDAYRDELIIPENSTGRSRVKIKLVVGEYELAPKAKTWVDYMTPEERAQYDAIRKAAEGRMPKPANLTELEKAQRALERAKAKIAQLTGAKLANEIMAEAFAAGDAVAKGEL